MFNGDISTAERADAGDIADPAGQQPSPARQQQASDLDSARVSPRLSQNLRQLPLRQMLLATCLVAPCLAFIFANVFVLWRPWGPPPSKKEAANVTAPLAANATSEFSNMTTTTEAPATKRKRPPAVMDNTVFTDFEFSSPAEEVVLSQEIKLLFLLAAGLGSVAAGLFSDVFGRSAVSASLLKWTVLLGLLTSVSTSATMFELLWCLVAAGMMGAHIVTYVRILEQLPAGLRAAAMLTYNGTVWALSRLLALFFSYVFKDWSMIVFFLSFCVLTALLLALIRPGAIVDVPLPAKSDDDEGKADSFYHVFVHREVWARTAAASFAFFVCGLVFYGFNLARKVFLTRSIFVNMIITGLVDFLAAMLAAATCHSTRRTLPAFMVFMALNGVCCLVMAPFEGCSADVGWQACTSPQKTIVFMGHFSSLFTGGASLNILWNFGVGVCSSFGRLGGIVGILLVDAGLVYGSVASLVVVGLLAWAAGVAVVLCLPERAARPLFKSAGQSEDFDLREASASNGDGGSAAGGGDGEGSVSTVSYSRSSSDEG